MVVGEASKLCNKSTDTKLKSTDAKLKSTDAKLGSFTHYPVQSDLQSDCIEYKHL